MSRELGVLLALTVLGAAWLVAHVVLVARTVRRLQTAGKLPRVWQVLSVLPPATPVLGWVVGLRLLPVGWIALAIVYAALAMSAS